MSKQLSNYVLISWLDRKDDPFLRDLNGRELKDDENLPIPGPIHGIVLDEESPYREKFIAGFILATRSPSSSMPDEDTRNRLKSMSAMIATSDVPFPVKPAICPTDDPTDHRILFSFCLEIIGKARTEYPSAHLVINTSSGTPAMHTVWVLLSETRQIEGNYTLVQGVPPSKRSKKSPSSVSPIHIGIDSAFGRYRDVKLAHPDSIKDVALDFSRAKSPLLRRLYADSKLYAAANIPLLILGERGSGKTELAKFIRSYYHAARAKKASEQWPTVNCGQFKGDPGSLV
jgi:sigma54-dependent transcription regulator